MAAANTYEPIATTTLGSAQATVSFTSITGSYTDLKLIATPITATGGDQMWIRYNGATSNYSGTVIYGDGTTPVSIRRTSQDHLMSESYPTTSFGWVSSIDILNYSNATTFKTTLIRAGAASQALVAYVGLYRSTSAITQIDLTINGGTINFGTGSTFTLYGIKAA